ncbi:MAG: hypothetical protein K9N49_07455 [Candidatus Marinimicrobia bacterium]|nr:hypothetical protein [Candidatus Neomarinimicrobiota bacterium]
MSMKPYRLLQIGALLGLAALAVARAQAPNGTPPPAADPLAPMDEAEREILAALQTDAEEALPPVNEEDFPEDAIIPIDQADMPDAPVQGLISLNLDAVPINDVIRMFTRISGANIIAAGTNLTGTVTVSLYDVDWRSALLSILESQKLTMVEKRPGIFSVISEDAAAIEPVVAQTIFMKYVKATELMPIIQSMIVNTNGSVSVIQGNGLVIQETPFRLGDILETVQNVDRPRPQVLIEAKFIELNDTAVNTLGVNWQMLKDFTVAGSVGGSWGEVRRLTEVNTDAALNSRARTESASEGVSVGATSLDGVGANESALTLTRGATYEAGQQQVNIKGRNLESFEEGNIEFIPALDVTRTVSAVLNPIEFGLVLSALRETDGVKVVSNPKLIVANGETATIHVGQQRPIIRAVPQGDSGDRYAYEASYTNLGVRVNVTPVVNTENNITVVIEPELTRYLSDVTAGGVQVSYPIFSTRSVRTEFIIPSGRTIAIGGLTETRDIESIKKVPILGDIPIIGRYLFSHTSQETVQDEIIIFVTVVLAESETLGALDGLPSGGRLIHRHMASERDEAARMGQ